MSDDVFIVFMICIALIVCFCRLMDYLSAPEKCEKGGEHDWEWERKRGGTSYQSRRCVKCGKVTESYNREL